MSKQRQQSIKVVHKYLWWSEWIIGRKMNSCEKNSSSIRTVWRAHDGGLPFEQIITTNRACIKSWDSAKRWDENKRIGKWIKDEYEPALQAAGGSFFNSFSSFWILLAAIKSSSSDNWEKQIWEGDIPFHLDSAIYRGAARAVSYISYLIFQMHAINIDSVKYITINKMNLSVSY